MSAEEGGAQPPTAGTDKAQAPKPAATFSSFINKNTTGKKFAPKAARRRPGAATAPKPATSGPAAPPVEAQTTQAESELSTAPEEPTPAVQLPTPAPTQERIVQDAPQPTPAPSEGVTVTPVPITVQESAPVVNEPLPTPAPTTEESQVNDDTSGQVIAPELATVVQDEDVRGPAVIERASKRRRMDPPPPPEETAVDLRILETPTLAEVEFASGPTQETPAIGEVEQPAAHGPTTQSAETVLEQPTLETEPSQPHKRRTLPWNAVNRPQEIEEELAPALARTRKPSQPRGKKNVALVEEAQETQETEQQDSNEDDQNEAAPVRKRPSVKARGKRRADAPPLENGEAEPASAKRVRRTRKVKSKATVVDSDAEDRVEEQAAEGEELVVRRKPRKPRQKKQTAPDGEAEDGGDGSQPKRKGRPPRESTPSDAEDNQIDPDVTFMDSLASRNIRVGKLSTRERKMREIDWVAVKQRQREEDTRYIETAKEREKAAEALNAQQPQTEAPRTRLNANGQIEVIQGSMGANQGDDTERNFAQLEVVQEENLTQRITSRSFLKNNKRFPNDFILPGQGKRWAFDDTERFYTGLKNFGTDFQMISHMFPGYSRRSIKLKFTREERENPTRVRDALLGQSQIVSNWNDFMEVSEMNEERLADADKIKDDMAQVESEMRVKIEAAKLERDERRRQQKEAGVLDEDEGGEKEKENGDAKGKKKRKAKGKQVTFREEKGVEILAMDDDPNWGQ